MAGKCVRPLRPNYCPNGGPSCASNNGNMLRQQITTPALAVTQDYTYTDGFSRLTSAQETNASSQLNWNQVYQYDNYGNRAVTSGYTPYPVLTPGALSQYVETINGSSVNRNHWTGATYDNAGNLASVIGTGRGYSYDAENRMIASTEPNTTGPIQYVYDGDGRRVQKTVGTAVTVYVYDASGEVAAEYGSPTDTGTAYLNADHLGSTRLLTNGSEIKHYDYFPFGEDIQQGIGARDATYPIGAYPGVPDSQAMKFTGKERDAETGLDYFGARYMSSAQGRFTSPDPIHIMPQKLLDPQQWNMYSYVRNNPLRLIDPTGMYICGASKDECKAFETARQKDLKSKNSAVRNAASAYGDAGKDNGVNVRFGDPGEGHNGTTSVQLKYNEKTNSWQAAADVVIKTGLSGNALQSTLGHEGVHVEDAQDFVSTITADFHYDLSKNLTHWQTEMNAYAVTAAIDPGHSYGTCGTGQCVLGSGMSPQAVRTTTMMLLANPANGYNRFVDVGNGTMVGVLGMRQFGDITSPNPPKQ